MLQQQLLLSSTMLALLLVPQLFLTLLILSHQHLPQTTAIRHLQQWQPLQRMQQQAQRQPVQLLLQALQCTVTVCSC
jgi:hypothetical protein